MPQQLICPSSHDSDTGSDSMYTNFRCELGSMRDLETKVCFFFLIVISFFKKKNLFIWLRWVLDAVHRRL